MRYLPALFSCAFLLAASGASAETRVFIVANQADSYGVDQCLARGAACGAHAALSYCRSRDFTEATTYHRVAPEEITGSLNNAGASCSHPRCGEYVAITCQR